MNSQALFFDSFYQNNYKKIENFLRAKCATKEEAEDLAQDCFIKFYQNAAKVESGKETSFLYTIANNLFIDQKRKETVKYKYVNSIKGNKFSESPEHLLLQGEFKEYIDDSLNALNPLLKDVFVMNKIEKKTYEEIATIIGLSVKSVEKKMSVALKTYREIKRYALR